MQDLRAFGIQPLAVDVTQEESLVACVNHILAEAAAWVDILMNNAGYGAYGALEDVPLSAAHEQLAVNVFGPMRLTQLVHSLLPYFEQPEQLTATLAQAKAMEAIELLLRHLTLTKLLLDFSKPFKIDLEAYINLHFMYNASLAQFAKLTGSSLATFKRDFEKVFRAPPEKWLKKRRLEQARFLLAQKQQRPSEVYLVVGFENLSHFSASFKEHFGYSPSQTREHYR